MRTKNLKVVVFWSCVIAFLVGLSLSCSPTYTEVEMRHDRQTDKTYCQEVTKGPRFCMWTCSVVSKKPVACPYYPLP